MAIFKGAGVALVTPMKENGEVNFESLERLLEDIYFNSPDLEQEKVVIDQAYVKELFAETIHPEDIDRYIL